MPQSINDILPVTGAFTVPSTGNVFLFEGLEDVTVLLIERNHLLVNNWTQDEETGELTFPDGLTEDEVINIVYRPNVTGSVTGTGTVREYIIDKLTRLGFTLKTTEIDALLVETAVDGSATFSPDTLPSAKKAIAAIIPELLVHADVSEGEYSIKMNRAGILAYYRLLCAELGIDNILEPAFVQPKIRNKSNVW